LWFWVADLSQPANGRAFTTLAFTEMTAEEAANTEAKQAAKRAAQPNSGGFGTQQGQNAPAAQKPAAQAPTHSGQPAAQTPSAPAASQ
jgi:hypothetical protein